MNRSGRTPIPSGIAPRQASHLRRVCERNRLSSETRPPLAAETTKKQRRRKREPKRIYDEAVREALILVWEAADRICGKRLKPLIPVLLEAMERHGHLPLDPEIRTRLLAMSAATVDRLLTKVRESACGARRKQG